MSTLASVHQQTEARSTSRRWISGPLVLPAAAYMLQHQPAQAAGIAEIIARFWQKEFKLLAIKLVIPTVGIAELHYRDVRRGSFFNGLCDFLCSGLVLAVVWEGEGVIKYSQKLIGANEPLKSEPGTIRGDLAVVVERNVIDGSNGSRNAKDDINLWFKPE